MLVYHDSEFYVSELSFANGDEISVVGFRDNSGKWRAVSVLPVCEIIHTDCIPSVDAQPLSQF